MLSAGNPNSVRGALILAASIGRGSAVAKMPLEAAKPSVRYYPPAALLFVEPPFQRLLSKYQAQRIAVNMAKLPESPRHFSLSNALVLNLKDAVATGAQRPAAQPFP